MTPSIWLVGAVSIAYEDGAANRKRRKRLT